MCDKSATAQRRHSQKVFTWQRLQKKLGGIGAPARTVASRRRGPTRSATRCGGPSSILCLYFLLSIKGSIPLTKKGLKYMTTRSFFFTQAKSRRGERGLLCVASWGARCGSRGCFSSLLPFLLPASCMKSPATLSRGRHCQDLANQIRQFLNLT